MADPITLIGVAASVGGTVLSALGSIQQGRYQEAALKAQAQAQEARAQEERAAAQREAVRRGKEAAFILSRQQALAAASGGGAADSTVLNLMATTAAEGQYQQQVAVYEGEARGRGLEYQAAIDRMQANAARKAGFINAGSSVLGGISSFARYYGGPSMPQYQPAPSFYG